MKAADKRRDSTASRIVVHTLANAEALARQSPGTFELPPLEERLRLQPGDCAKLVFQPVGHGTAERTWVRVVSCSPCGNFTFYRGTLANEPIEYDIGLRFGAVVSFTSHRIVDLMRAGPRGAQGGRGDA